MKKILIINICKEKLHYYEFVKPVEDIIKKTGKKYFVKHYKELKKLDLENAERIIICGTSLKDNEFMEHYRAFDWLLDFSKPILGICGGMQIMGMVFGNKFRTFGKGLLRKKIEDNKDFLKKKIEDNKDFLKKKIEIGFYKENFKKEFLGLQGEQEVYHLHNYYLRFLKKEFEIFSGEGIAQAVKHKQKNIFGVLFHPEVRQKILILEFLKI